jgi:hypothetical protein
VGIAGEDDLDAPDLAEGGKADAANKPGVADVQDVVVSSQLGEAVGERRPATAPRRMEKVARPVLGQEQSAALREKLLADLCQLQSGDAAADWVHKNLAAKNTLIPRRPRGRSRIPRKAFNDRCGVCRSSGTTAFDVGRRY